VIDIELSTHAKEMLKERNLLEEWVWRTIATPDSRNKHSDDGNMHYGKSIEERDGRVLHVVVNQEVHPHRIVTVFFDRRFGRKK
jgi:hypothetical protein